MLNGMVRQRRVFGKLTVVGLAVCLVVTLSVAVVKDQARGYARHPSSIYTLSSRVRPAEFARMPASYHPPAYDPDAYRRCYKALKPSIDAGTSDAITDYITGFANARKLGNATVAGFPTLGFARSEGRDEGYELGTAPGPHGTGIQCAMFVAQLDYRNGSRQLPPISATFLGFGFEPVTATVSLVQYGSAPLVGVWYQKQGPQGLQDIFNTSHIAVVAHFVARVSNVTVNGVPLNVGGSCRSDGPLTTPGNGIDPNAVVLVGGDASDDPEPVFYNIAAGGALAGLVTIPPLTGCVTPAGENLDALLTSTVSGPRNYVQAVAGPACFRDNPYKVCSGPYTPMDMPVITVTHGGDFSVQAPFKFESATTNFAISCTSSIASGTFPNGGGPVRGAFASVHITKIGGCAGNDSQNPGPWKITQSGVAEFSALTPYYLQPGTVFGAVDRLTLAVSGPNGCSAHLIGAILAFYSNSSSTLELDPSLGLQNSNFSAVSSNCPDIPATSAANQFPGYSVSANYAIPSPGPVINIATTP